MCRRGSDTRRDYDDEQQVAGLVLVSKFGCDNLFRFAGRMILAVGFAVRICLRLFAGQLRAGGDKITAVDVLERGR